MRRAILLVAALVLVSAERAQADGLPIVDYGVRPTTIPIPDTTGRLAAFPAGPGTAVAKLSPNGEHVRRSRHLPGVWSVPAVAYDGTPGGYAADGSVVALIKPRVRFPRRDTDLVLLNRRLEVVERIHLDGDFSFDAISPDGAALFLVEYPNRKDPSDYRVRVYDVASGRLLPKPLIDARTAPIVMRGLPVTRTSDPAGRVAYTLYDGYGAPFIHALDTVEPSALCIPLAGEFGDPSRLRLRWRQGAQLAVTSSDTTMALVDPRAASARPAYEELFGGALALLV